MSWGPQMEKLYLRFSSLTSCIREEDFSILDYGCGLAYLLPYLQKIHKDFYYTGVDILEDFIQENKERFPDHKFKKINSFKGIVDKYDFIVISGVFNVCYVESEEEHKKIVLDTIKHLFSKTRKVLAINFQSVLVDYIRAGNYHQDVLEIYNFVAQNLSKRIQIDQSYMPYEFTISIYKDQRIKKPSNIYY